MDPLALLSDDDDDDGDGNNDQEAEVQDCGDSEIVADASPCKRLKTHAVDLNDLQRAGYNLGEPDDVAKQAEAASLESSFALLEQVTQPLPALSSADKETTRDECKTRDAEFGCEAPPDSIELYDQSGGPSYEPILTFEDADAKIHSALIDVMRSEGFVTPTPIQAHTWPILMAGRDLIGVAKTGSGKTLAFLLPCFACLLRTGLRKKDQGNLPAQMQKQAAGPGAYSPEVLVLAPSRELANQIEAEAKKFTASVGISTLACYGGGGFRAQQLGRLRERPECVVGTVGRLNDFLESERHWFGVKTVRFLILDEADAMLSEGLSMQIRNITTDVETPNRQTMLFSATFADDVRDLASWILKRPVEVRVGMRDPLRANPDIDQRVMIVKDEVDKEGALKTILRRQYSPQASDPGKVLIFAVDFETCDTLAKKIKNVLLGAEIETLHGNRKQHEREKAIASFRSGDVPILISTNVAGRGLDIKDIKLVINFDPPEDSGDYVHRIGRTARAGQKGAAITLLRRGPDGRAMAYIAQVMRRTGKTVPQDLIDALKQRRGRDMEFAAQLLQGLCNFERIDRDFARMI